jgi:hypothetical protein
MATLDGRWKVRRESGLLPPFGIGKRILGARGWTELAHVPLLPFRVEGLTLSYLLVPIRDELTVRGDGTLGGVAYFLGFRFCRFRMEPVERRALSAPAPPAGAR